MFDEWKKIYSRHATRENLDSNLAGFQIHMVLSLIYVLLIYFLKRSQKLGSDVGNLYALFF
jgi:hypothetical protein